MHTEREWEKTCNFGIFGFVSLIFLFSFPFGLFTFKNSARLSSAQLELTPDLIKRHITNEHMGYTYTYRYKILLLSSYIYLAWLHYAYSNNYILWDLMEINKSRKECKRKNLNIFRKITEKTPIFVLIFGFYISNCFIFNTTIHI